MACVGEGADRFPGYPDRVRHQVGMFTTDPGKPRATSLIGTRMACSRG